MINDFQTPVAQEGNTNSLQYDSEKLEDWDIYSEAGLLFIALGKCGIRLTQTRMLYLRTLFAHPENVKQDKEFDDTLKCLTNVHNRLKQMEKGVIKYIRLKDFTADELDTTYAALINIRRARIRTLSVMRHAMEIGKLPPEKIAALNVIKDEI